MSFARKGHRHILHGLLLILVSQSSPALALQDASFHISLGDSAYNKFDNRKALTHYLQALEVAPNQFEAQWKAVRAYTDVGKALGGDAEKAQYLIADSLSAICVELYPDSSDAHFVRAMALGRLALYEGGKRKVELSKEIEIEAKRTIELNPMQDGGYHILGRWNFNIATLNWFLRAAAKVIYGGVPKGASVENAAKMFRKAAEIAPYRPVHTLELGRSLIELKQYQEAREALNACLKTPIFGWEDDTHHAEARKLLHSIRKKS